MKKRNKTLLIIGSLIILTIVITIPILVLVQNRVYRSYAPDAGLYNTHIANLAHISMPTLSVSNLAGPGIDGEISPLSSEFYKGKGKYQLKGSLTQYGIYDELYFDMDFEKGKPVSLAFPDWTCGTQASQPQKMDFRETILVEQWFTDQNPGAMPWNNQSAVNANMIYIKFDEFIEIDEFLTGFYQEYYTYARFAPIKLGSSNYSIDVNGRSTLGINLYNGFSLYGYYGFDYLSDLGLNKQLFIDRAENSLSAQLEKALLPKLIFEDIITRYAENDLDDIAKLVLYKTILQSVSSFNLKEYKTAYFSSEINYIMGCYMWGINSEILDSIQTNYDISIIKR